MGPSRAGGPALIAARSFVDGCETVPVTAALADATAALRAHHRALSLPDALTIAVADAIGADLIWTYDRRWSGVDPRAGEP